MPGLVTDYLTALEILLHCSMLVRESNCQCMAYVASLWLGRYGEFQPVWKNECNLPPGTTVLWSSYKVFIHLVVFAQKWLKIFETAWILCLDCKQSVSLFILIQCSYTVWDKHDSIGLSSTGPPDGPLGWFTADSVSAFLAASSERKLSSHCRHNKNVANEAVYILEL